MVNNFGRLIDKRYASALPEEGREFFHFILDGAPENGADGTGPASTIPALSMRTALSKTSN